MSISDSINDSFKPNVHAIGIHLRCWEEITHTFLLGCPPKRDASNALHLHVFSYLLRIKCCLRENKTIQCIRHIPQLIQVVYFRFNQIVNKIK